MVIYGYVYLSYNFIVLQKLIQMQGQNPNPSVFRAKRLGSIQESLNESDIFDTESEFTSQEGKKLVSDSMYILANISLESCEDASEEEVRLPPIIQL